MNVILVPMGSHGDVHPFVGLGIRLRARGHAVSVIVNPHFQFLIDQAGLNFIPLGTDDDYRRLAGNPDLWKPVKGTQAVFRGLGDLIRPVYERVVAANVPGQTVVAAATLALGARVAQDKHAIPTATIHLQPSIFRSVIDPPVLQGMLSGPRVPRWLMRLQWFVADRAVIDRLAGPPVNQLRGELGMPRVRGIVREYIHSPQRVIGMFPDWYAPPQADWPPQVRLSGFPLYDEAGVTPMDAATRAFLSAGDKPIAFTFGSAMWHAHDLLEQSARACQLLNRRGILLTRHRAQVPPRLPGGVRHLDFAPLSELLPHCCALVHHGGIGTASQALAAGVPALVLPHAHDQPDNAARLMRLGVAKSLSPNRYTADRAAQLLADLIGDRRISADCQAVRARFLQTDALGKTCDLIEGLLPNSARRD